MHIHLRCLRPSQKSIMSLAKEETLSRPPCCPSEFVYFLEHLAIATKLSMSMPFGYNKLTGNEPLP